MGEAVSPRPVDRVIKMVATARRRRLLHHFLEGPSTTFRRDELARMLHRKEEEEEDLETLDLALAHHLLPKFHEVGIIEYDPPTGTVRPADSVEAVRPLLDACEGFPESSD